MAKYRITAPDGHQYEVNAPDDATEEQVLAYAQQNYHFAATPPADEPVQQSAPQPAPIERQKTRTAELVAQGAIPASWQIPVEAAEQGLRAARQGLTFGFSDELAGLGAGANALLRGEDPRAAYREGRDRERALSDQFAADHPVANLAGQFGGGLLTGAAPARAVAQAPGLIRQFGRGVLAGGAGGGLAGLGASEAETLGGAAADAGIGAGLGAGAGAVAAPALMLGGAGLQAAARKLRSPRADTKSGVDILAGATSAVPRERAISAVRDTLRRSNMTPEAIEKRLASDEALGTKPEVLADYLGDHGARRLYSARTLGGRGSSEAVERLMNRSEGSAARVSEDVQRATTRRGQSLQQLDTRIENRRKMGNTLYREAYKYGEVKDPATLQLVQNPRVAGILKKAADRRGLVADLLGEKYVPLFRAGEEGPVLARAPTVEDLHLLKTSLDDDIRQAYQAGEGQLGGALRTFKNDLVAKLEGEVPAYRKARETYRGDMEIEEAIVNGRNDILRKPVDELRRDISALSAAERDAYRSGAIDAVLSRSVDRRPDGSDFARVLWGNSDMRNRLRLLVQDESELARLVQQLEREKRMTRTNQAVLGGSQTAMRNADIDDTATEALADVVRSGVQGAAVNRVQDLIRRGRGLTEPVADDIARLLMAQGPKEIRAVLATLKDRERIRVLDAIARQRASGAAGNVAAQESALHLDIRGGTRGPAISKEELERLKPR